MRDEVPCGQRDRLAHLARYLLRPPIALGRLELLGPELVCLELVRSSWTPRRRAGGASRGCRGAPSGRRRRLAAETAVGSGHPALPAAERALGSARRGISVEQHADPICVPLERLLFPDGVPADLTVAMLVRALGAAAERQYGVLVLADVELMKELSDDAAYRTERDDATADLRVIVQRARGAMTAGWGEPVLGAVGLSGEMPKGADQLAQATRAAADLVERAELGPALLSIDRAAVATQLRAGAARVERALTDVTREEREAQDLRTKRDDADATVRRVYVGFADVFAGLAAAVGRYDVASRVRPTSRRRAGLPEEEDVLALDPTVVTDPVAPTDPA